MGRLVSDPKGRHLKMERFGHFGLNPKVAFHVYEGDYMVQENDRVVIYASATNPAVKDRQVAIINLDKGQSVRKLRPAESVEI
jgi:hypothetical protein